jgi:AcrR family transcriptional regulator
MPTPTRILRTIAEELDRTMHDRTAREDAQYDRIMACAPTLLTFWNTDRISFTALAIAMKMAPATLRRHFVDIPALLGFLIRRHLKNISAAIAKIPFDAPDRAPRRRAAYLAFTRKPLGAHTEIHLLMLNTLPVLPDDVRIPLLETQAQLATSLAPPGQAEFVLSMLDNPYITPRRLEAIVATEEVPWFDTTPALATLPEPQPQVQAGAETEAPIDLEQPPSSSLWIHQGPRDPMADLTDAELPMKMGAKHRLVRQQGPPH